MGMSVYGRGYQPCRMARLLCSGRIPYLPFYRMLELGGDVGGGCRVGYVAPNPCVLVPSTRVSIEEYVEYKVEPFERNYLVELRFASGAREYYVYPRKVWDEVNRRFIGPLSEGKPPREQGALLYGPPGTGKTSMAIILAEMLGLATVKVDASSVLSKWLGESEERFAWLLDRAESLAPSLLLFDDAEWLTRARRSVHIRDASGSVYLALMSILLERLQEWKRRRKSVVAIVTTNVGEEYIDPALRRSGRLGRPIFVPLPDYEAVYLLLTKLEVEEEKARELAVKIVNAGLPMSDVVQIAADVLDGKEPVIEPVKGHGYRRTVPPLLDESVVRNLGSITRYLCSGLREGSRLGVPEPSYIGIPIVTTVVGTLCRRSVVVAVDPRDIDEAVTTADTVEGVLVIPADFFPSDVVRLAISTIRSPIILVGPMEVLVAYPVARLPPVTVDLNDSRRVALMRVIAEYYGLKLRDSDLRKIRGMSNTNFRRLLEYMALYHGEMDDIFRLSGVWRGDRW